MVAFSCYHPTGAKAGARCAWRAPLPEQFDAEVDAQLQFLSLDWELGVQFKELRTSCEGLTEIIIELELPPSGARRNKEQVHIRILGFGSADHFVLLYAFRKY